MTSQLQALRRVLHTARTDHLTIVQVHVADLAGLLLEFRRLDEENERLAAMRGHDAQKFGTLLLEVEQLRSQARHPSNPKPRARVWHEDTAHTRNPRGQFAGEAGTDDDTPA